MGASISASRYRDVDLSFHNGFKVQAQKNVGILEMSNTSEKFSLEILSIHYNEFDGEIPLEFCHLSQLRVLNLAQSRIAGILLRCFSNFSAMIGEARKCEHWLYAGKYDENALVSWKQKSILRVSKGVDESSRAPKSESV
ncbi:hypothetical protein NC652_025512 [Populus alba x Populus x berolinensis]|nr:hypothetical protein NC652_025512 [Populus alba x Populus x berolinensis]